MSEIVCVQIDIVLHMRDGDRRRICHADGIEHAGECRWTLLTLSLSMAFIFFIVALPMSKDLLISAKHLFIAAMAAIVLAEAQG
jgi:hypothetical protein